MKNNFLKYYIFLFIALTSFACEGRKVDDHVNEPVKNVIFLMGDPVEFQKICLSANEEIKNLKLLRATDTGYIFDTSNENEISDPGSRATAYAIGQKPINKALGVDQHNLAHPNLIELASVNGLSTGVTSRTSITNPVSAAFLVHGNNLTETNSVALEILNSPVDILIACGLENYRMGNDVGDLTNILQKKGFKVYFDAEKRALPSKFAILNVNNKSFLTNDSSFKNAFKIALESLKENSNGFLLVVDAGEDHSNEVEQSRSGINYKTLDDLIGNAFDFADNNPGTLVIVTSYSEIYNPEITPEKTIPLFAYGAGSESFKGSYENISVFEKIVNTLELSEELKLGENEY